jgi:serine/threonine-protein kinase
MSETKPPAPLAPGMKVGPYTLRGLLGRGRDTEVYLATSPELKRDVALKIYRPAPDRLTAAEFKSELGTIAALKHPNLMRVYDFGVEGDWHYVAMELVQGTNLRDKLSAHPRGLGRDETLLIFSQIASAVATAHDQNVTHGNIKPDNVLLDKSQRPVLTDFNIPCLRECGDAFRASTPAYLAPEQFADGKTMPQSDIYALGILLYEMLTGDVPFKGSYEETAVLHQSAPPKPPSRIAVGLDPRIEQAILKALNKGPSERFGSAREMLAALEKKEAVDQYRTVSLNRDAVQKRRAEIKAFEQSRLDAPPASENKALTVPTGRLPLVIGGVALGIVALIIILLLVL